MISQPPNGNETGNVCGVTNDKRQTTAAEEINGKEAKTKRPASPKLYGLILFTCIISIHLRNTVS